MSTGAASFILLLVTGLLCVWGIFTRHWHDNLLQRLGLSLLALWCLARLPVKAASGETEPVHLVLHVGLALLAIGTALSKYINQRKGRRP